MRPELKFKNDTRGDHGNGENELSEFRAPWQIHNATE
jgi:hypothetical protein